MEDCSKTERVNLFLQIKEVESEMGIYFWFFYEWYLILL